MDKSSLKQKAISGMMWKFLERVSSQAVGLGVSIIIARMLEPEEFGLVALTMIFIVLADVFVSTGFSSSLVQQGRYDEEAFSTIFWAGLFTSIFLYVLLFMIAPFIGYIYQNDLLIDILRVLGLRLPISAYNSIQQAYVMQKMLFRNFFYSTLSGTIISAIVGIYMAMTNWGVWALVGQNLIMLLVNMLVLRILVPWRPRLIFSKKKFYHLFAFGYRIMLTSFIGTLFDQLRGFFIGFFYRPADLAFCNRGERLPQALAENISSSIDSVMFAALSKIKSDRKAFLAGVRAALCMTSFLVIPLMAIMAGASSQFVEILLTKRWMEAVPYMQLVCLQQIFRVISTLNLQSVKASGHADMCLKLELWKKPIYTVFLLATIWIGPLAVVAGNTIYSLVGLLLNMRLNKKLFGYGFLEQQKDFRGNFVNGIVVFFLVLWIGYKIENVYTAFVVQLLLGILGYWSLAVLCKTRGYNELCRYIRDRWKLKN